VKARQGLATLAARALAAALLLLLALPLAGLASATTQDSLWSGLSHPLLRPALALSAQTNLISLVVVISAGLPLAWWIAKAEGRMARLVEALVDVPLLLPPAVLGVALLQTFGRKGLLGAVLSANGLQLPFSTLAVVVVQVVVGSPFFVQAAVGAFRNVNREQLEVARTLGASPQRAFLSIVLPQARPALVAGASLAFGRSLGEFGATLLFAGNLTGTTQTLPLAIFTALESDVAAALTMALLMALAAALLILGIRASGERVVKVGFSQEVKR